ncbi:hypothetical protein NSK11_contig00036-0066 [Nocardia seriolae]|uniref:Uncharacterized protein n=1 Tax=Nocardia seriolae TaxID=37332 RepID=A0ABC9YSN2_9NOCA|nr:hypothetical protein NSERKGN1266_65750 [Nocardia seriolae]BEK98372.1 hypothetical protein NSER024013_62780 [Nocardia seriolae]GAM46458.1 hypothetical protein NS07_v2contig00031-0003 [Nocardia seriolae]GAP28477.1 hypothetical protein NSK11_contig00036-0066 [Nocardia seriolae]GEM24049.1 hypothetical protein NS2_22880 [Nocardia seriolae NBRC 15557]
MARFPCRTPAARTHSPRTLPDRTGMTAVPGRVGPKVPMIPAMSPRPASIPIRLFGNNPLTCRNPTTDAAAAKRVRAAGRVGTASDGKVAIDLVFMPRASPLNVPVVNGTLITT